MEHRTRTRGAMLCLSLGLGLVLGIGPSCAIFKTSTTQDDTASSASSDAGSADGGADGGAGDAGAGDAGGTDAGGTDGGGTDAGGTDGGGTDGGGTDAGGTDGGGTDGGATDPICDRSITTGPPTDACVTDRLVCDDDIVDTLYGGQATFGADAYLAWYCVVPEGDPWAGVERIYAFNHPGTGSVDITLDSPCAEMDLAVVRWGYFESDDECPVGAETLISECEMDDSTGGGTVSIWNNTPADYLIIVDSVDNSRDNFGLSISCP